MMIVPLAAAALLWFLLARTRTAKSALGLLLPGLPTKAAAVALAVLALIVAARGNLWAALCLFGVALWVLGRSAGAAPRNGAPGGTSMIVEDADGPRVGAGRFAGMPLDALDLAACLALRAECAADAASARRLESYLDRRFAGWRPTGDGDADARRRARFANEMSEDQAYQVLGLARGATRSDIVRSHRLAMKRWHPDQGGSAEQAARANEAKEVLLRRHG